MVLWRSFPVLFLLALVGAQPAFGQAKNSPIAFVNQEAITVTLVAPPNIGGTGSSGGSSDNNQWLKVEFHYGTTPLVTKDYPYVDAVEFRVWIEGLDLYAKDAPVPGKGAAVALTGTVDYINVAMGKDIYGSFYVNPSTLVRYSSDRGADDFDRKFNIHLEAYVGGVLMDLIDKTKEQDPKWYKPLTVIPGLVYRQDQCPFIVSDTNRYPMISPSAPSASSSSQ